MSAIIVDMSQYESVKYSQQLGNKANMCRNYHRRMHSTYKWMGYKCRMNLLKLPIYYNLTINMNIQLVTYNIIIKHTSS